MLYTNLARLDDYNACEEGLEKLCLGLGKKVLEALRSPSEVEEKLYTLMQREGVLLKCWPDAPIHSRIFSNTPYRDNPVSNKFLRVVMEFLNSNDNLSESDKKEET